MSPSYPKIKRMEALAETYGAPMIHVAQLKWFFKYNQLIDRSSLSVYETSDMSDNSMDCIVVRCWINPRSGRSNCRMRYWSGVSGRWTNTNFEEAEELLREWERNRV